MTAGTPTLRLVRRTDLAIGDVLWMGATKGGWRIDRLEPYVGVNVDNGTFPPDTKIAFMSHQGSRLEMTITCAWYEVADDGRP